MTDLQSVALPLGYAASLDPEAKETTRDDESVQPPTVASRANPFEVALEVVIEVVGFEELGAMASSFRFARKESTHVPS